MPLRIARYVVLVALLGACGAEEEPDAPPPPVAPSAPASSSVTVTASSTPPGANVTGGGRALGVTPLQAQVPVPAARPGEVQTFPFTFTMPGYEPVTLYASPVNQTIALTATMVPIRARAPEQPLPRPVEVAPTAQPSAELAESDARRMILRYYASRGEWSGQYEIAQIERMRMDRRAEDRIEAHTRYRYHCIVEQCGGNQQVGTDQRIFYFQRRGDAWQIVRMGDHMSARI
jgi:hypothetical protein